MPVGNGSVHFNNQTGNPGNGCIAVAEDYASLNMFFYYVQCNSNTDSVYDNALTKYLYTYYALGANTQQGSSSREMNPQIDTDQPAKFTVGSVI